MVDTNQTQGEGPGETLKDFDLPYLCFPFFIIVTSIVVFAPNPNFLST